MGATSTTGTGPGHSNGKHKPENSCGCNCCSKKEEPIIIETNNKITCNSKIVVNNSSYFSKCYKNQFGYLPSYELKK